MLSSKLFGAKTSPTPMSPLELALMGLWRKTGGRSWWLFGVLGRLGMALRLWPRRWCVGVEGMAWGGMWKLLNSASWPWLPCCWGWGWWWCECSNLRGEPDHMLISRSWSLRTQDAGKI